MFLEALKNTYQKNKNAPPLLLRNILKETVQFYVSNFLFNSPWAPRLIMKEGTCLRFCFDLPRFSEDLDFDVKDYRHFDIEKFALDIKKYFQQTLQFPKIATKIAGNRKTAYLKFPVLRDLNPSLRKEESEIIHLRIDLSATLKKDYPVEISLKSTDDFTFLIRRYGLPELLAGKVAAILTRGTIEGKVKAARFKGRDFYDLIWFLEKGVSPNWEFIKETSGFNKAKALQGLREKTGGITPKFLKDDLLPFFKEIDFVNNFSQNFSRLLRQHWHTLNH